MIPVGPRLLLRRRRRSCDHLDVAGFGLQDLASEEPEVPEVDRPDHDQRADDDHRHERSRGSDQHEERERPSRSSAVIATGSSTARGRRRPPAARSACANARKSTTVIAVEQRRRMMRRPRAAPAVPHPACAAIKTSRRPGSTRWPGIGVRVLRVHPTHQPRRRETAVAGHGEDDPRAGDHHHQPATEEGEDDRHQQAALDQRARAGRA